jgi:hypothetical protein
MKPITHPKVAMSFMIDPSIRERLVNHSNHTGRSMSETIQRALVDYLGSYDRRPSLPHS